uniref:Uncharacterized protein n=1 Tax=Glossina brevipalpis TaxID=37001 RepID=A0A1A9W9M9_9MUSC
MYRIDLVQPSKQLIFRKTPPFVSVHCMSLFKQYCAVYAMYAVALQELLLVSSIVENREELCRIALHEGTKGGAGGVVCCISRRYPEAYRLRVKPRFLDKSLDKPLYKRSQFYGKNNSNSFDKANGLFWVRSSEDSVQKNASIEYFLY